MNVYIFDDQIVTLTSAEEMTECQIGPQDMIEHTSRMNRLIERLIHEAGQEIHIPDDLPFHYATRFDPDSSFATIYMAPKGNLFTPLDEEDLKKVSLQHGVWVSLQTDRKALAYDVFRGPEKADRMLKTKPEEVIRTAGFSCMDNVIRAAKAMKDLRVGSSALYKDEKNGMFYFLLQGGDSYLDVLLLEYAPDLTDISPSIIRGMSEFLPENAIQTLGRV